LSAILEGNENSLCAFESCFHLKNDLSHITGQYCTVIAKLKRKPIDEAMGSQFIPGGGEDVFNVIV